MKFTIFTAALLLAGCVAGKPFAGRASVPEPQEERSSVPVLVANHTVAEIMAMLAVGRQANEIRPLLGIPILSAMRSKYLLKDGWISTDFRHYLINDEQSPSGDVLKASPEE